jgi:hypothetical protein
MRRVQIERDLLREIDVRAARRGLAAGLRNSLSPWSYVSRGVRVTGMAGGTDKITRVR